VKQKRSFVLLIVIILVLPLLAWALFGPPRLVVKPEAASRLDELLVQWTRDGTFTGSVLVAQDGVVYLSKGYGLADRAQKISNTSQTRFHLGSISKQFTAMAILILQSQGRLSVQDPICNHIANCPAAWQGITIHQVLTHTAGLSPRLDDIIMKAAQDPTTPPDPAYFIKITGEVPLKTHPGEQFAYSNFGYDILAHIIEQASGQSYAEFLEENIFTPLNMRNTGYEDSSSEVAAGYTDRYDKSPARYILLPISDGEGQLYSTSEDLLLWDQALYTDQLVRQDKLEPMFERFVRRTDEVPIFGYGYGWLVTKLLGRPLVGGAGYSPACATFYLRYPTDGLTLIVLMNQGDIDQLSVLFAIAGALFLSDLVFILTTIPVMLLLAVLLAAQKNHWVKTTRAIGIVLLLLAVPFAIVFSRYLAEGRSVWTLLPLSLVLLYMLAKAVLDFVFKIDFRRRRITRLANLTLMCLALFSLIWIAFGIHPSWGAPVLIAFGILAVSLIFLNRKEIRAWQAHAYGGSLGNDISTERE
jgi:CubicO group peptidase (beta-lactamase class C family)